MRTRNIKIDLEPIVMDFVKRISLRPEVLGIVLLGGMGKRNFMDKYSDVDISVFVSSKSNILPLPFEFHHKEGEHILEFNIRQLILADEINDEWSTGKKEAYLNGLVVCDKTNSIEDLIKAKCTFDNATTYDRLIWLFNQYRWRGQIHSVRTYHRGDIASAHYLLNNSLQILVEILFLLNKRYLPHPKWIFLRIKQLPHKYGVYKWLKLSLKVPTLTYESLQGRITLMNKVYFRLLKEAQKIKNFPKNPEEINRYYWKHNLQPQIDMPYEILHKGMTKKGKDDLEFGSLCYKIES